MVRRSFKGLLLIWMPIIAWAESPVELPSYCSVSTESSEGRSHKTETWMDSLIYRGLASTLQTPQDYVQPQKVSMGCLSFKTEARKYAIASMLYKQKQMERLFPDIQRLVYPSCPGQGENIQTYIQHLNTVPPLSEAERPLYLKETLSDLMARNIYFQKHYARYQQALKDMALKPQLPELRKNRQVMENELIATGAPKKCESDNCTVPQAIKASNWAFVDDAISSIETKIEAAKITIKNSEPFMFAEPDLVDFKSSFRLDRDFTPSPFSKNIFKTVEEAARVANRGNNEFSEKLRSFESSAARANNFSKLEEWNSFFRTHFDNSGGQTSLDVAEGELHKAYEKNMKALNWGLKQICQQTDFQLEGSLAQEVIALAPESQKAEFKNAHCDCLKFWPMKPVPNTQGSLGLLAAGVSVAGAYFAAPVIAIAGLALGVSAVGTSVYNAVRSHRRKDASKSLHRVGFQKPNTVGEQTRQAGLGTYGALVDVTLLPLEVLSVRKAVFPERQIIPNWRHAPGELNTFGLLKKIKVSVGDFRKFSYAITQNQKDVLNFVGDTSPKIAEKLAKRIASRCDTDCTPEKIQKILENSADLWSFKGMGRTPFGQKMRQSLTDISPSKTGRPPETLSEKISFFEEASRFEGTKSIDFLEILNPLTFENRQKLLRAIKDLDFKKGLDPKGDSERFSQILTQLKFFGNYKNTKSFRYNVKQASRCNDINTRDQALQCHVFEQQILESIVSNGFKKSFRRQIRSATQDTRFQNIAAKVLERTQVGFWKSKNIDPEEISLSAEDFEHMLKIVSRSQEQIEDAAKAAFEHRPNIKEILSKPNGENLLNILKSAAKHFIVKGVAVAGVVKGAPYAIEFVQENKDAYATYLKRYLLPSDSSIQGYNCGQLSQLVQKLDTLDNPEVKDTENFSRVHMQTYGLMTSKNCYSN